MEGFAKALEYVYTFFGAHKDAVGYGFGAYACVAFAVFITSLAIGKRYTEKRHEDKQREEWSRQEPVRKSPAEAAADRTADDLYAYVVFPFMTKMTIHTADTFAVVKVRHHSMDTKPLTVITSSNSGETVTTVTKLGWSEWQVLMQHHSASTITITTLSLDGGHVFSEVRYARA